MTQKKNLVPTAPRLLNTTLSQQLNLGFGEEPIVRLN